MLGHTLIKVWIATKKMDFLYSEAGGMKPWKEDANILMIKCRYWLPKKVVVTICIHFDDSQ